MLEKKNGGLMLQAHVGELCGRELDPQCFSGNGPFRGQLHARPIIHKKKYLYCNLLVESWLNYFFTYKRVRL